jgi:predicted glycoside hydrolase/deacetylase ChbG (UPF0249 family)
VLDSEESSDVTATLQNPESAARKPERLLVVNADDMGWSRSVNRGIIEAHRTGIVTQSSIIPTAGGFEHGVAMAKTAPKLAMGVHLEMYRGEPLLPVDRVKSLVDSEGKFLGSSTAIIRRLAAGGFDMGELEAEFRAQVEQVKAAGLKPSHLNSEKHLHMWPSVFDVVCRLAREFEIPYVRVVREPFSMSPIPVGLTLLSLRNSRAARAYGLTTPDGTIGVAEAPTDRSALERILASGRGHRVELVVHPGHIDEEFWELQGQLPNKLTFEREEQLSVLAHPDSVTIVERLGYKLEPDTGRG